MQLEYYLLIICFIRFMLSRKVLSPNDFIIGGTHNMLNGETRKRFDKIIIINIILRSYRRNIYI